MEAVFPVRMRPVAETRNVELACRLQKPLQPGKGIRDTALVLLAQLGCREAALGHGHQRLPLSLLESEFEPRVEARSVETYLRRRHDEASRALDDLEHVPVHVQLAARGPEVHGPDSADPQVAARLDYPALVVLAVERLLALGVGEGGEDLVWRRVDQPGVLDVVAQLFLSSTCIANLSSRRSQERW